MDKDLEKLIAEFRDLLLIDKNRLDEHLQEQAEIFYRIADALAQAQSVRDKAKEDISITDAQLNLQFRKDLEEEGTKVTDAKINAMVQDDDEHHAAFNEYMDAKEQADKLSAMREAWMQRSYMLRELVGLFISGYFADQTLKGGSPEAREMKATADRAEIHRKRKQTSGKERVGEGRSRRRE